MPVNEIERLVLNSLKDRLGDKSWLADQAGQAEEPDASIAEVLRLADAWSDEITKSDGETTAHDLRGIVDRIDMPRDRLRTRINLHALSGSDVSRKSGVASFEVPFQKRQNGRAKPIILVPEDAPKTRPGTHCSGRRCGRWEGELLARKSLSLQQITEREGLRSGSVSRIVPLVWLAPDIATAILEGRQPLYLNSKSLRSLSELPLDWEEQRQILGFPQL
ncbi:MAG: hypothetical protein AAFQ55_08600 [Pseudomonadota bacterium]